MPPPVHGASMMGQYIHDSELINQTFDCLYMNLAIASSLEDIQKFGIKKFFRYIALLWRVIVKVISFKPHLVYFTPNACGKPFYKEFPIMMILKLMRRRIVIHYHNKGVSIYSERLFDNILYRIFFWHVKVVLLSERLYPDIKKYVKRENVKICPNGIPVTEMFGFRRCSSEKGTPVLLFLSNLIPSKGVWLLLEALFKLSKCEANFKCVFSGGESAVISAEKFENVVREKGLEGKVFYYGPAYGQDKINIFQHADVFIFPTFYPSECFPLVLLEAMQSGLPCITTSEGGIPDIVMDKVNGLVFDTQDPERLATLVLSLLNNPHERYKMGLAGREMYKKSFTLEIFQKHIVQILKWAMDVKN